MSEPRLRGNADKVFLATLISTSVNDVTSYGTLMQTSSANDICHKCDMSTPGITPFGDLQASSDVYNNGDEQSQCIS